jgi:hypothetical protein
MGRHKDLSYSRYGLSNTRASCCHAVQKDVAAALPLLEYGLVLAKEDDL